MKKLTIITALLLVLMTPAALAATNITGCQEITESGDYILIQDITVNGDTDAVINTYGACFFSDNASAQINILGNGYTITENGVGVYNLFEVQGSQRYAVYDLNADDTWSSSYFNNVAEFQLSNVVFNHSIQTQLNNAIVTIGDSEFNTQNKESLFIQGSGNSNYEFNFNEITCSEETGLGCLSFSLQDGEHTFNIFFNTINNTATTGTPRAINFEDDLQGQIFMLEMNQNIISEADHDSTINATASPIISIEETTWLNPSGTGHSETCTNDGLGFCVEDYEMFVSNVLVNDTLSIALSMTPAPLSVTNITGCGILTKSSETYQLTSDIYVNTSNEILEPPFFNCILSETADNIIIEGNGYGIYDLSGTGSSQAIGFYQNNITIQNLTIDNSWSRSLDLQQQNLFGTFNLYNINAQSPTRIALNNNLNIITILNSDFESSNNNPSLQAILFSDANLTIENSNFIDTNLQSALQILAEASPINVELNNVYLESTNYALDIDGAQTLTSLTLNTVTLNETYSDTTKPAFIFSLTDVTYSNLIGTGFSDTCTNDGTGYCEENYTFSITPSYIDTMAVALNEAPPVCVENWLCIIYNPGATCDIDDTITANCVGVVDTNACGTTYTGDYSEFAPQVTACDYCTPAWSCDGYESGTCPVSEEFACNSAADSNSCFATTGLPSDDYSGDYSEFAGQACTYISPVEESSSNFNGFAVLFLLVGLFGTVLLAVSDNKQLKQKYFWVQQASIALMIIGIVGFVIL